MRAFLAAYSQSGSVSKAARAAKMDRQLHYRWLAGVVGYAEEFDLVRQMALDELEGEAFQRSVYGIAKPVMYKGQLCYKDVIDPRTGQRTPTKELLTVQKYSDKLLIALLKRFKPEHYRDYPPPVKPVKQVAKPISLTASQLAVLSDEELHTLRTIQKKLKAAAGEAKTPCVEQDQSL